MIKCQNCGVIVKEKSFCPECGAALPKKSDGKEKNKFVKFLMGIIVIQILLYYFSMNENSISGLCYLAFLFSFVPAIVVSICCIIQSKKIDNKKGKKLGITFTIINSIGLIASLFIVITFFMFNGDTIAFEKEINKGVDNSAQIAVDDLKDNLKDPSSLKINRIAAEVYDTRITWKDSDGVVHDDEPFTGYYKIYIDYTAKNGFGGVNREQIYYEFDENFKVKNKKEIDEMPLKGAESTFELEPKEYE